ncbi:MAG TPA: glycosyltransferase family 2 protein [Caldilineaceae bacterium]|nr:glycosyltransferase family 2 protein [Caldilineaceae bacterium]
MTTVSIVIPAYNEEDGIQEILERVLSARTGLQSVGVDDLEVIVVDDGSADRTAEKVMAYDRVRLIRHVQNGGYGAALKTGFAAARGEWIGFLDADGTYPPEYFPQLYQAGHAQNADLVIGSRMAGADSEMPKVRRLGNLIFARLVSLISAKSITDSASGMRLFKKSILSRLYPLPDGLNLTPVMSTRALHEQLTMVEVPIPYSERVGRSKLSVFKDGMRFAQSIVWTALNYNPVRPLGLLGLGSLAIALLIGLGIVLARLQGVTFLGPLGAFTLFAAVILAVAGISLLTLGVSFNYFVALFHKTPVKQGLFGKPLFPRLDQHFGWVGVVSFVLGAAVGVTVLLLGTQGLEVSRYWFYYLISAGLCLVGIQLVIGWIQIQVLETLRMREALIAEDLQGKDHRDLSAVENKKSVELTMKTV